MNRARSWSRAYAVPLLVMFGALASACATAPKREIVDVAIRQTTDLAQGRAVVIVEVKDSRTFVASGLEHFASQLADALALAR